MISERTLRKWRKESLMQVYVHQDKDKDELYSTDRSAWYELNDRIVLLAQELMDIYLINKEKA